MGIIYNSLTPSEGLILSLDTANRRSYPGSGNTWFDLSGNNNHGTLTNGASLNTGPGGGMNFDGVNDYVAIADSLSLRPSTSLSIGFWVKLNTVSGVQRIVDKESGTPFYGYDVFFNGNKLYGTVAYNANNVELPSATTFTTGIWYHIVVTYGSGSIKYFVNGVLDLNNASAGEITYTVSMNLAIGTRTAFTRDFANCQLDDIRLYSRALSESEIRILFNSRRRRYGI